MKNLYIFLAVYLVITCSSTNAAVSKQKPPEAADQKQLLSAVSKQKPPSTTDQGQLLSAVSKQKPPFMRS